MPYIGQPPVTGDTTSSFRLLDNIASYTLTFNGSSAEVVSTANDTLTFSNHRFVTAQRVTYTHGGGTAIGGLTSGTAYYIIKVDQNTIKLATSAANANNNSAIDLTSLGVGVSHTLNVAFDGINTKFKATYNNGTKAQLSRAGQLLLSINGVIQQPQETSAPTVGFGIDADSTIVFSVAPAVSDVVFGNIIANSIATFDISDNNVDNFTGNGSTLAFTLSKTPANNQNVLVTLDGVVQYPSDTTTTRAYSVTGSTLTFASAPANGVEIQVRHIGFAGATSSAVTGFYGRTGNAVLTSADDINVQNITGVAATFTGNVSIAGTLTYEDVTNVDSVGLITARSGIIVNTGTATTALVVNGNARVTGILTIGTSSITLDGSTDAIRIGSGVTITSSGIVATSGVTTVSAGSTAAPSITPTGDTNTGIFFPSADTIAFAEGGVEAARIDSSGRFGIGTNSPGRNLTVQNSSTIVAASLVSNPANIAYLLFGDTDSDAQGRVQYDNSSDTLQLYSAGTERARITSTGLFGIGNNSPGSYNASSDDLVVGDHVGAHGITICSQNNTSGYIMFADGTTGAQTYAGQITYDHINNRLLFGTNDGTTGLAIDSSQRVGIGTTSLTEKLHVDGNIVTKLGGYGLLFGGSTCGINGDATTNYIQFYTNNSERARIDSSGRLLVGTSSTSAESRAEFVGNSASSTGSGVLRIRRGSDALLNNNEIAILTFGDTISGGESRAVIGAYADGTGGIGDLPTRLVFSTCGDGASSPTSRFIINSAGSHYPATDNSFLLGTASFRWSAVYAVNGTIQTSDAREKTEVTDAVLGSDFIKSLRPVSYKWLVGHNDVESTDDGEVKTPKPGVRTHWGFIAQEVKQAVDVAGVDFGGWVLTDKGDSDSQQGLRYDQFIAPLTKALQEALAEIDVLKAKVAALESA